MHWYCKIPQIFPQWRLKYSIINKQEIWHPAYIFIMQFFLVLGFFRIRYTSESEILHEHHRGHILRKPAWRKSHLQRERHPAGCTMLNDLRWKGLACLLLSSGIKIVRTQWCTQTALRRNLKSEANVLRRDEGIRALLLTTLSLCFVTGV